jgi:hypothetical protein
MAACGMAASFALLAAPAGAVTFGGYHIFPLPHYYEKTGRLAPSQLPSGPMFYYGGSVFSNVKVVSVIWGDHVLQNTIDKVPIFSAELVNSTYVDQELEYSTKHHKGINGHGSTHQIIGRGTYIGQVQIAPKHNGSQITDDDIHAELKFQIKNGVLPPNDLGTLYMIYFPSDVTISLDGLVSCQDFGAYHFAKNDTKMSQNNIFYSVEPECGSGFSFLTFAASHEFTEASTDNIPTPGSVPDFPQAWNDANGFEDADKCSGHGTLSDGTNSFNVSQYYLNSKNGCSTGNYTSP